MPTVIAVDAMGSDRAPKPEVEGAILAARQHDIHVLLVGPEDKVRAELRHQNEPVRAGVVDAVGVAPDRAPQYGAPPSLWYS